jgi:hypothetical protein
VSFGRELILLAAGFGAGVAIGAALGAENLGVAFGIGQISFAATLVWILIRV